jgi:hypothetical protein
MPDQSDDPDHDYSIVMWWAVAMIIIGIALLARSARYW